MRMRIRINVVDPLPCGGISRAAFIGMSWQKHAATFRGRRDFEEIRYLVLESTAPLCCYYYYDSPTSISVYMHPTCVYMLLTCMYHTCACIMHVVAVTQCMCGMLCLSHRIYSVPSLVETRDFVTIYRALTAMWVRLRLTYMLTLPEFTCYYTVNVIQSVSVHVHVQLNIKLPCGYIIVSYFLVPGVSIFCKL